MSDIDSYKPKMESAASPEKVPVPCIVTPKGKILTLRTFPVELTVSFRSSSTVKAKPAS